jgi:hypothetical protein
MNKAVALCSNAAKAEPIQRRLEQAGVPAELKDGLGLERFWFVSKRGAGVRIEVSPDQFERAERLLLDWDTEGALRDAIRCPECKSLRVDYPQYAQHSLLTNLALGLIAELGLVEKDYYCEDCHFTWPKEGTRPRRDRNHLAPFYFIDGVEQTTGSGQQQTSSRSPADRKAA